jgi:hypothetical protein
MLVNRVTWIAKRGHKNELAEWFRHPTVWEWKGIPEELRARAMRLYTPKTGAFDTVVLEIEFDNLEHYEKWWEAIGNYNATPERSAQMQRFLEITETGGTHELWNLAASQ